MTGSRIVPCADDVIAVLNIVSKKGESTSPNKNHFTFEFDIDDVTNDAQCGM